MDSHVVWQLWMTMVWEETTEIKMGKEMLILDCKEGMTIWKFPFPLTCGVWVTSWVWRCDRYTLQSKRSVQLASLRRFASRPPGSAMCTCRVRTPSRYASSECRLRPMNSFYCDMKVCSIYNICSIYRLVHILRQPVVQFVALFSASVAYCVRKINWFES